MRRFSHKETFQSFWHGGELNPEEWACIKSFLMAGHNFVLYSYQKPKVPRGAILRPADEILEKNYLFDWRGLWAPFSNVFRYALLEKKGGWWVDTDVVCVGNRIPCLDIAFAEQQAGIINGGQMKFPKNHPALSVLRKKAEQIGVNQTIWGELGPRLLTQVVCDQGLKAHVVDTKMFYPIHWLETYKFWIPRYCSEILRRTQESVGLHLWTSQRLWPRYLQPPAGSYLELLFSKYPFHSELRKGTKSEYDHIMRSIDEWLTSDMVLEWATKLDFVADLIDSYKRDRLKHAAI
jgi:Alpha 1,4-glycosyltransferase conserved region/Glycosyltransferase sugar-binding region containing DXD motif